jgi:hypothetical protein
MTSLEFESFIKNFNQIIDKAKSETDSFTKEKLIEFTSNIEEKINEAIILYPKELDHLFLEKKIYSVLDQMKLFCEKFGKVTYILDESTSQIKIKKKNRWVSYSTVPIEVALSEYFGISKDDRYYSFIGSYLSTEDNFTLIQIFKILFTENVQLN